MKDINVLLIGALLNAMLIPMILGIRYMEKSQWRKAQVMFSLVMVLSIVMAIALIARGDIL